jgi:hypothetical protein
MMPLDPDALSLVRLGQEIFDGVVSGYATFGAVLPDRQYVTLGPPANDCEQMVVSWQQIYLGTPGDEASQPQRCDAPKSAVWTVQIARKMPVVSQSGKAPEPTAIQTYSEALLVDAWLLTEILANVDPFQLGTIVTCEFLEVSGGLGCVSAQTVLGVP